MIPIVLKTFHRFCAAGFLTKALLPAGALDYSNPIIGGDWSDPGIIRVGEDQGVSSNLSTSQVVILNAAKNPRIRRPYRDRTRGFFAALRMTNRFEDTPYYTCRSMFGWQPGIPIAHSRDLVHLALRRSRLHHPSKAPARKHARRHLGVELGYNPNTKQFLVYAPTRDGEVFVFIPKSPKDPTP